MTHARIVLALLAAFACTALACDSRKADNKSSKPAKPTKAAGTPSPATKTQTPPPTGKPATVDSVCKHAATCGCPDDKCVDRMGGFNLSATALGCLVRLPCEAMCDKSPSPTSPMMQCLRAQGGAAGTK